MSSSVRCCSTWAWGHHAPNIVTKAAPDVAYGLPEPRAHRLPASRTERRNADRQSCVGETLQQRQGLGGCFDQADGGVPRELRLSTHQIKRGSRRDSLGLAVSERLCKTCPQHVLPECGGIEPDVFPRRVEQRGHFGCATGSVGLEQYLA